MSAIPLAVPKEFLKAFCERNHIRKLSLFGSVLTPRFRPDSDLDVLVEFDAGHVPGLVTLAGMEMDLSEALGRQVDLRTPEDLSRYFRDEVVSSASCNMNASRRSSPSEPPQLSLKEAESPSRRVLAPILIFAATYLV